MPRWDAEHDGEDERGESELERRRHAIEDELERGFAVHERIAEVAARGVAEEVKVLLVHRPVEAEALDEAVDLLLRHVVGDQDVHRIADEVHADEDHERHHQDDHQALEDPPDDEDHTISLCRPPSPACTRRCAAGR